MDPLVEDNPHRHDFNPHVSIKMRDDEKYIVFQRNKFFEMMGYLALPPWRNEETGELVGTEMDCAPFSQHIQDEVEQRRIWDAVVIRKQDVFAGPALHTYAASIALVAKTIREVQPEQAARLQAIADYFDDCAMDADTLDGKFPD